MDWRVVGDFLKRWLWLYLAASVGYLILSSLTYSISWLFAPGLSLMYLGAFPVVLRVIPLVAYPHDGISRTLLALPIERSVLARTHLFLAVGVPLLWVFGLTLIILPFAASGNRFTWIAVFVMFAAVFACAGILYCLDIVTGIARATATSSSVLLGAALMVIALAGGGYFLVPAAHFGELPPALWALALGLAASAYGFRRIRTLLDSDRANVGSWFAAPRSTGSLPSVRFGKMYGFASVALTCFAVSFAIAAAMLLLSILLLAGRNQLQYQSQNSAPFLHSIFLGFSVLLVFVATALSFVVPRVICTLPFSPEQLSLRVSMLPVGLALILIALAAIGFCFVDSNVAMQIFLALLGATGVSSLYSPAWLIAWFRLVAWIPIILALVLMIFLWTFAAFQFPVLQAFAPLVLVGGTLSSWYLSRQVIAKSLWSSSKPLPFHHAHSSGVA